MRRIICIREVVSRKLIRGCRTVSKNGRILLANSKSLSFSRLIFDQHKNDLTESSNSSGVGTDKAFYDKVF